MVIIMLRLRYIITSMALLVAFSCNNSNLAFANDTKWCKNQICSEDNISNAPKIAFFKQGIKPVFNAVGFFNFEIYFNKQ